MGFNVHAMYVIEFGENGKIVNGKLKQKMNEKNTSENENEM